MAGRREGNSCDDCVISAERQAVSFRACGSAVSAVTRNGDWRELLAACLTS